MTDNISRRVFFKTAAAATGAVALVAVGASTINLSSLGGVQKAFAASGDAVAVENMVPGVAYTVSANLYVPYSEHNQALVRKTAYLTNPNNPLDAQDFPTSPMSDNATIVKDGDQFVVTIPVGNELFSLIELGTAAGVEVLEVTRTDGRYTSEQRIDSVKVRISQLTEDPIFDGNKEYAAYPIDADYKTWCIWMNVDFSSIKEA